MHSFMLVRHGHVVAEGWWTPYDAATRHELYSLSKSFTSTAAGLAIAEGKFSLDDPVLKFFPDDAPAEPSENLRAMQVRHLLSMATGHETEPQVSAADQPWTKTFLAQRGPAPAGHAFPVQHGGHLHGVGHRAETDGRDGPGLSPPAAVRSARDRESDLGNQPARDHAWVDTD